MRISLQNGSETIEVEAEWIAGRLWYHLRGVTRVWEPERRQASRGQASQREEIHAPMPGRVTKILKNIGDAVAVGDVVLVMEAMKMEYSLKSEVAGRVAALECAVSDQVSLGQLLVKFEVEKSS